MSTDEPGDGVALCLSGGGYRAMLFHVGVVWRLHEAGWLQRIDRVSSVSGGSITSGVLALAWTKLSQSADRKKAFQDLVVAPVRKMAGTSIDTRAVLVGALAPAPRPAALSSAFSRASVGFCASVMLTVILLMALGAAIPPSPADAAPLGLRGTM